MSIRIQEVISENGYRPFFKKPKAPAWETKVTGTVVGEVQRGGRGKQERRQEGGDWLVVGCKESMPLILSSLC